MTSRQKDPKEPEAKLAHLVSAYTSHFGKDDDQTTVTEEQRRKRQTVAADLVDK